MKNRDVSEFLQDMLEAIQEIEAFTAGVDFAAFQGNREKILAVVKLLEILGEAVKQMPDELRDRYPHIAQPWPECGIFWCMSIGGLMWRWFGHRCRRVCPC